MPRLTPGIAFNALSAVFAAVPTVPTSTMELKNCFDSSFFAIPYICPRALTKAISIGMSIAASANGIGTAPTTTAAVVDTPVIP